MAALQSPCCHGSALLAHLWGPVVAGLLLVPAEQYGGRFPVAQHQAPGIARLLPALASMEDLQRRVTAAAAELAGTVMQADAAVLCAVLGAESAAGGGGSRAQQRWLLDAAPDVAELAVDGAAHYTCAPSVWSALAGCGHPVVSATLVRAAASLAPLSSAAAEALGRLQQFGGATALDALAASRVLPEPDTGELCSTRHAVYAVEAAGWLQQQFLAAAATHLHACSARSRLFLLPPAPSSPPGAAGSSRQPRIDSMLRQLAAAGSPPLDSSDAAAYTCAVQACAVLMLQGKAGPSAVLAGDAERALVLSCGVGVQQLRRAMQDALFCPGSACAEGLVAALQQELARIQQQHGAKVRPASKGGG